MTETVSKTKILLARLVVVLMVGFVALGIVMHGLSVPVFERIWQNLLDRPSGPMTFRFILQPVMAAIMAAIDGIRDARTGTPPYFWSLITGTTQRVDRIYDGVIATSRVILLGLGMDVVYQLVEFKTFYPGEAAIVAVLLAFIPYMLLRGPFARLARMWGAGTPSTKDEEA